jgi:hypothetical protein
MTHYHVFQAVPGIQVAVTSDSTGKKLPKRQSGGWYPMRTIAVRPGGGPLIDADSDEVIAAIDRDGYFLWPKLPRSK